MDGRELKQFSRRVRVSIAVLLGGLSLVVCAAFRLQVIKHDQLSAAAHDEYLRDVRVPAHRGDIYDRNGKPLAVSVDVPSIYVNPMAISDPRRAARDLARVLKLDLDTVYGRLSSDRYFAWIKRRVTPEEAAAAQALGIAGLEVTKEPRRVYPNGEEAAQLLGYAGLDSQGLEGVEHHLDEMLQGEAKVVAAIRDARGRAVLPGVLDPQQQSRGADVSLTIDLTIQHAAQVAIARVTKETQARSAMAVVLDVATAEVLAIAVHPTYNANDATRASTERRRNRAVTDLFEPGSTMKPLVIAAALEAGVISSGASFFCENGSITIGGHTIRDTEPHGWLTLKQIIAKSSNIGATKVGKSLGRQRMYDALRSYGFGERTGVEFPGEVAGMLKKPSTWSEVGTATISFGHGVAVNAIQLAAAYRVLAAGGEYVRPTLVSRIVEADGTDLALPARERHTVLSHATITRIVDMMEAVVAEGGTGLRAAVPGYRVAGKTGTAQKIDTVTNGYSSDKFVAIFAGFLPAQAPRVVTVVAVDEPQTVHTGGAVAAPAFSEIGAVVMRQLGVAPTLPVAGSTTAAVGPSGQGTNGALASVGAGSVAAGLGDATEPVAALDVPETDPNLVPSLLGLSSRQAMERLVALGMRLDVDLEGSGQVVDQKPKPGTKLGKAKRLHLVLAGQ